MFMAYKVYHFCFFLFYLCIIFCAQIRNVYAETEVDSNNTIVSYNTTMSNRQRLSLAHDFVAKLKAGFFRAEKETFSIIKSQGSMQNTVPDGEVLLLQPRLDKNFRLGGVISAQMHNGKVALSLSDFVDVLQLAIHLDADGKRAFGWYIREEYKFSLDIVKKEVVTAQGTFNVSADVFSQSRDIFIPIDEFAHWFGFKMDVDVSSQELSIKSEEMFPVQENEERKNRKQNVRREMALPELPLGGETYTRGSIPVVDVRTTSTFKKGGGIDEGVDSHQVYVKTVGDVADGTLTTLSQFSNEDQLKKVRATYERESLSGDLLGVMKAKHIEIGDITTTTLPLSGGSSQELGVRITNTDPVRNFTRASTVISGNALPGWDVELYRGKQYLTIFRVGDDGFYHFDDVKLYTSDNNFRLRFHGPQGEEHEEMVSVPYDRDLLSNGDGIYDVSVSFDGQNSYVNDELKNSDNDRGSVNVSALYEKPIADGMTGSFGFYSDEEDEHRNFVGNAGLSWVLDESLINADVAVDDEGDGAAEFSVRRDIGEHSFNYTGRWRGANFDDGFSSYDATDGDTLDSSLSVNGPLSITSDENVSARYSASLRYSSDDEGDELYSSTAGMAFGYQNVSFNDVLTYKTGTDLDDDILTSKTNFNIREGKNTLRLTGDYYLQPDLTLDTLSATFSRDFTDKLDMDLSVTKNEYESLVEYEARLDWQAGFVRISPSVSYNTQDDFFAGVSTRFGLMREPVSGDIKMYDRTITGNSFVSAFVYLDKDGDGVFNGEDEPLPDIVVSAPQNGRKATTDEEGVALFDRMMSLRLTDVFVAHESLPDPAWVPGFKGVSILPRQGYVAQVEFPIHLSGELDGTVYAYVKPSFEVSSDNEIAQIEPASGVAPKVGEERADEVALQAYRKILKVEDSGRFEKEELLSKEVSSASLQPVPLRNIELRLYNDKGKVEQKSVTESDGFYYFSNIPPGRYFLMMSEESARRKNVIRPKPEPIEIGYDGAVIYGHKIFVDMGEGDVPSEIVEDMKVYKERHPHVSFDEDKSDLVLNLGDFNSRLLMSLVWYELKTHYKEVWGQHVEPLVKPAQSYADLKTGKHTLRVAMDKEKSLDDAYALCRSLMAREQYCKVEIYPSYMKKMYLKMALLKEELVSPPFEKVIEREIVEEEFLEPIDLMEGAFDDSLEDLEEDVEKDDVLDDDYVSPYYFPFRGKVPGARISTPSVVIP